MSKKQKLGIISTVVSLVLLGVSFNLDYFIKNPVLCVIIEMILIVLALFFNKIMDKVFKKQIIANEELESTKPKQTPKFNYIFIIALTIGLIAGISIFLALFFSQ